VVRDILHRDRRDQFHLAVQVRQLHHVHADALEPTLNQEAREPRADVRIGTATDSGFRVPLDVPGEGAVIRMTEVSAKIDVDDGHDATWPDRVTYAREFPGRCTQVREHEPDEREIELLADIRRRDV